MSPYSEKDLTMGIEKLHPESMKDSLNLLLL